MYNLIYYYIRVILKNNNYWGSKYCYFKELRVSENVLVISEKKNWRAHFDYFMLVIAMRRIYCGCTG